MSRPDDFEIIDERDQEPRGSRSLYIWIGAVIGLILFGFAVGLGYATLMDRLSGSPTPSPMATETRADSAGSLTGTAQPSPEANASPAASPDPAATETPPATPSPTVSPTPSPSPTASCSLPIDTAFELSQEQVNLGCAASEPGRIIWAAWEPFQRGAMLWRSDNDQAYIFLQDGQWWPSESRWDGQEPPSRGTPPPGLYAPVRGFGFVWGSRDDVFDALGWATDREKGFCARVQEFDAGFVVQSSDVASCTADGLYNQATAGDWQPILLVVDDDGRWKGRAGSAPIPPVENAPTATPTPPQDQSIRPPGNGVFPAAPAGQITLDGSLSEWPDRWTPLNAVVFDVDGYQGATDLSGAFQLAWSGDALFVAVRVLDDQYRAGPNGTDLWQGDSLEIHFDRLLDADYDSAQADADDYQVGLSFGPGLDQMLGYRWLPFDLEGSYNPPGRAMAVATDGRSRGYAVEVMLPWPLFQVPQDAIRPGATFGFNLSINDNDGEVPAQQTVISASPRRTTHDRPMEWGTLILEP